MATAELLALTGLRVIASPIMKKLVDKGFSYVGMDVPSELKNLVDRVLPQLAIAKKASDQTINIPELEAWLQSLKDTYDEAEDILDEVEYKTIAKKIKHEKRAPFMVSVTSLPLIKPLLEFTDKKRKKFSFLSSNKRKLWFRLNKLKNNVKGLVDVATKLYAVQTPPNGTSVRETTSLPLDTIFIGRNIERKIVINELLKEPDRSQMKLYSVVAILGVGGYGKTTLAQNIYNDNDVANHLT